MVVRLTTSTRWIGAAACAAALVLPGLAAAQDRLSVADRLTRLEQQAAESQGSISLVNRVQALQEQIQQLQGQVEQLQHQLRQADEAGKSQYVDLDSRIARLEGRGDTAAVVPPSSTSASAPAAPDASRGTRDATQVDAPAAASTGDPQVDYDRAFSALRNGDFAAASRLFSAFTQNHPDSQLTPNAYYWLGESYYGTQNYAVALDTFRQLLTRYPNDAKAPGSLLKVGYCQYELKDWDAARATLNEVVRRYPDSQEARLAEGRLRALDLQAGR